MVHASSSIDRRQVLLGLGALLLSPACTSQVPCRKGAVATAAAQGDTGPLVAVKPDAVGMSADRIADVFARLERRTYDGLMPGCTATVVRRGKIVGEHASGTMVRGRKEPVKIDTIFDLLSVSKVLSTSTAAMVLIDQGKLKLDDPVVKYLPAFVGEGKDKVTVRQMLSYSAGLPLDSNKYQGSPEEIWRQMFETKLEYPPGTKVMYSDLTYRLLGKLLEAAAGKPLDEFARANIWQPLGMADTMYNPPAPLHSRIATTAATEHRTEILHGVTQDDQDILLGGVVGCDGVFSTAKDMAIFGQMVLNGGIYAGKRIVSAELANAMVANQTPFVDASKTDTSPLTNLVETPKGYGWELFTHRFSNGGTRLSPGSYGKAGGTGCFLWIDPVRQIVAVLLSNRGIPVPFDDHGWDKLLDDTGCGEFFDGVIGAVVDDE